VVEIMDSWVTHRTTFPEFPASVKKTAQALIKEHGTIENLLANAHTITRPKLRQSLMENAGLAG